MNPILAFSYCLFFNRFAFLCYYVHMFEMPTDEPIMPQVPVSVSHETEEYPELEAEHFKRHPDQVAKPEVLRDCGPEVEKLEGLMGEFEARHSLAELNAITEISPELFRLFERADELESPKKVEDAIKLYERNNPAYVETYKAKIAALRAIVLSPDEARKFEIRRAAMKDMKEISILSEKIRKGTNVSEERFQELQVRYKSISCAVGFMNKGVVSHDLLR